MTAPPSCGRTVVWSALAALALAPAGGPAQEPAPPTESPPKPLHERIDRLVEESAGPFAPLASDEEFLRRASLDLTGLPPTPDEVRVFAADGAPDKRTTLVDRLLTGPAFPRHLANVLDVMLMERRPAQAVPEDEWRAYLLAAVRQNKPFNVLARELLSADGTDPATRPAARFFLDRAVEPNLLTRDIGRIFFGRDMQCAQCHDHPLIDDYKQADYQGLLAFVQGSSAFTAPAPDGKVYVAERAGSEIAFESVFVKGERHSTGPRVPGGAAVVEPAFHPGDEYTVAPAEGVRPVPKFSRRTVLAEAATSGTNRWFNENVANRLWAVMMGRGLVHPPDLHHTENPPTHPELLKLLGDELVRTGFNVRSYLRELALTRTYQRAIDLPLAVSPGEAAAVKDQLTKRQAELESVAKASSAAHDVTVNAWQKAKVAAAPVKAEVDAATAAAAEALKPRDAARVALNQARTDLAAKQDAAASVAEAAAKAQAAAAKLPQDAEFAAATAKIAERNTQLAAEAAALAKALDEKQAALIQTEAQLLVARMTLDGARARLAPLAEAIRVADEAAAAARQRMLDDAILLAGAEQAAEAIDRIAAFAGARDAATTAIAAVPAAENHLAAARQAVLDHAAVIAQADNEIAAAKQKLVEVQQQHAAAEQEAAKRKVVADSLGGAVAQATSASGQLPEDAALVEIVKTLQAKSQEAASRLSETSTSLTSIQEAERQATTAIASAEQARQAAMEEQTRRQQATSEAEQALATAQAAASSAAGAAEAAEATAIADRVRSFAAAPLKPLSPEQLCFAMLRATGHYEITWKAEEAALNQAAALPAEATAEQIAARQVEIEQKVYDKLKAHVPAFAAAYAAGAGQPQGDFFATADQALLTANGGAFLAWLGATGGNLTERMINEADPKAAAEDLYLTVLSRRPTDAEVAATTAYLASRPQERAACVQELVWALLTSVEFRFNH